MKYSNRDNEFNYIYRKERSVEKNINDYFKDRLFVPINEYPYGRQSGIDLLNFKKIKLHKPLLKENLSSFRENNQINLRKRIRFDSLNNSKPDNSLNYTSNRELPDLSFYSKKKKVKLRLPKKTTLKLLPKIKIKSKKTSN